jgi:hypothetical protein
MKFNPSEASGEYLFLVTDNANPKLYRKIERQGPAVRWRNVAAGRGRAKKREKHPKLYKK